MTSRTSKYRQKLKEKDPDKSDEYKKKQRIRAAKRRKAFAHEPMTRAKEAKIEEEKQKRRCLTGIHFFLILSSSLTVL